MAKEKACARGAKVHLWLRNMSSSNQEVRWELAELEEHQWGGDLWTEREATGFTPPPPPQPTNQVVLLHDYS